MYNSDFRKFSESCRHDGLLRDRREEPARDEYDYDCVDGEDLHAPATSEPPEAPVMWIITEEQKYVKNGEQRYLLPTFLLWCIWQW